MDHRVPIPITMRHSHSGLMVSHVLLQIIGQKFRQDNAPQRIFTDRVGDVKGKGKGRGTGRGAKGRGRQNNRDRSTCSPGKAQGKNNKGKGGGKGGKGKGKASPVEAEAAADKPHTCVPSCIAVGPRPPDREKKRGFSRLL